MTHMTPDRTRSMGLKLLLVGGLVLLLGIPLIVVNVLAWERAGRAETVAAEIGQSHGGPQTLRGPFLVLPVERTVNVTSQAASGSVHETRQIVETLILSPDTLNILVDLETRVLRRAIYETPVYESHLAVRGRFDTSRINGDLLGDGTINWSAARITYAVSDLRGMGEDIRFEIVGRSDVLTFEPESGFALSGGYSEQEWRGMSAPLRDLEPGSAFDFDGELHVLGASRLGIVAAGRETSARITSDWQHPGFQGAYLPDTRDITDDGFAAEWRIPYLARGVPASWIEGRNYSIRTADEAQFAIQFISPADGYVRVSRSLKYAMGFLGLTLLLFFLIEASGGRRLHAAQYILIGMTQITFYLLLLALSEHVPVWTAYAIAATATVILTALYARSAFRDAPRALLTFAGLTLAFSVQFVLILVEDYALLIGSVLAFGTIASTMYLTRQVDWYGLSAGAKSPTEDV